MSIVPSLIIKNFRLLGSLTQTFFPDYLAPASFCVPSPLSVLPSFGSSWVCIVPSAFLSHSQEFSPPCSANSDFLPRTILLPPSSPSLPPSHSVLPSFGSCRVSIVSSAFLSPAPARNFHLDAAVLTKTFLPACLISAYR